MITAEPDTTKKSSSKNVMTAMGRIKSSLLRRRAEIGITQREVSNRIKISLRQFQRWEANEVDPNLFGLVRWADALGMSLTLEVRS